MNQPDPKYSVDPKDLKAYVDDILNQRRSKYEPDWYRNKHAYEGNHFVGFNRVTGTVQIIPSKKRFFLQLPETKRQCDAFENLLLKENPLFQVYPTDYDDQVQIDQARMSSLFLRQKYLDYKEANVLHDLVHHATVLPISFIEIAKVRQYDQEKKKMVSTTAPRVYDAFDVAFDARFAFEDNPMIVKVIRTTPRRMKQSNLYKDFAGGDVKSGTPDYKEMFYQDKFGSTKPGKDFQRTILYECHIKEERDGVPGIHIITIDNNGKQLRDEYFAGMPFYSIIPFQPYSGNPYQPSFAQNLGPLNRSLDLISNRIESMMMKIVKGSYLVAENSDVTMTDEDGTVVKYRGQPPTVLPQPVVPASAWQWVNTLITFAERYGVNHIAIGGTPQGSQFRAAGMMQQALQGAVMQQKTPLENLTYTMRRMAEVILFMESTLMDTPQDLTLSNDQAEPAQVTRKFVGADQKDLYSQTPNMVFLPKTVKKMSVEIEDAEASTIASKRQSLIELITVFPKTPPALQPQLLSLYKVGNTADIMSKFQQGQTILDSPEMQAIIAQNRQGMFNDNPQLKQAIGIFLQFLAKQSPVPHPDSMATPPGPAGAPAATPPPAA